MEGQISKWQLQGEKNTSAFVMPSHYNCCVPLCTTHSRKNRNLSFYRIPKDENLRKKYTRLIRNKTLKLESSHTRICSAHFEGGKKKYYWQLPSIFPWSKPSKGNYLQGGGLVLMMFCQKLISLLVLSLSLKLLKLV